MCRPLMRSESVDLRAFTHTISPGNDGGFRILHLPDGEPVSLPVDSKIDMFEFFLFTSSDRMQKRGWDWEPKDYGYLHSTEVSGFPILRKLREAVK